METFIHKPLMHTLSNGECVLYGTYRRLDSRLIPLALFKSRAGDITRTQETNQSRKQPPVVKAEFPSTGSSPPVRSTQG